MKKLTKSDNRVAFLTNIGKINAKKLREFPTMHEKKVFKLLKDAHINFKFQYPIICNRNHLYILDFYIPDVNLAIEVNGGQHYSKQGRRHDSTRKRRLKKEGITVYEIKNSQAIIMTKEDFEFIYKSFK